MTSHVFAVGDAVRFDAGNGSYGRVVEIVDWPDDTRYHVRWEYGRDARGEMVTAVSRYKQAIELIPVSDEEYTKHTDRRFNQKEST